MRASVSILLWILVGAVTASAGVGYFLHRANRDLATYASRTQVLKEELEKTKTVNDALTQEANTKIKQAELAVEEARLQSERLREEQRLLTEATPLKPPAPSILKTWNSALSVPLGVSLRVPPGSHAVTDGVVLGLAKDLDVSWLTVTQYDANRERSLFATLTNTSTLLFVSNQELLLGMRGTLADTQTPVYILHHQTNGTSTHLLWGSLGQGVDEKLFLTTLATLSFRP